LEIPAQPLELNQEKPLSAGIHLLRDAQFLDGFQIISPTHGKKRVTVLMQPPFAEGQPAWALCQWHSKYDLSLAKPEKEDAQTCRLANEAKSVVISKAPAKNDLVLSIDSHPEYGTTVRKKIQPWPHLLVQQDDVPIYMLRTVERIDFKIDALLVKNRSTRPEGYSKNLHTAQFLLTFVVQNRNENSPGFGDFIWFNVCMYDERSRFCNLYASKDTADPSAKMIYAPPGKTFSQQTLHDGKWVTFSHKNLCPLFREGINAARNKGFLKESSDPDDFAISSVILGWEITGINDASMRIRNLDIKVHVK